MKTKSNRRLLRAFLQPGAMRRGATWLATWGLLFCSSKAGAVAFRLPNQDPEGIARGNAFAATADNPSAIYYNPAGITQLQGQNLSIGYYLISANDHFTSATGGATAHTDKTVQVVPQFYYTYSPTNMPLTFGLGVYVPYGLSLDWGQNPPFRNVAMRGSLLYSTVNPVIAWKAHPTLSLAIGPTINYSKASLVQGIVPGIPNNDQFRFVGDNMAYGFNAGARWQPMDQLTFGLNYRYLTTVNYKGSAEVKNFGPPAPALPSSAEIRFPQFVAMGVSYRPTENWNFEVDVDWTDWDNVNSITFKNTPLGNIVFPLNYTSSFMYEFGVTRKLGNGFAVSAGYIYSENSVPEQFFNPIIPDGNLQLGSLGLSHKGKKIDWAIGYHFAYSAGRTIGANNVFNLASGGAVAGKYSTFNNAVNLSVNLKF